MSNAMDRNFANDPPEDRTSSNFVPIIQSRGNSSDVLHMHQLSYDIGALYLSDTFSDVTFVLDDGSQLPAHRVIMAARSQYFRALLYNGMRETEQRNITLVDTSDVAFKHIMRYVYTSKISLGTIDSDVLLDILGLAHRYSFDNLLQAIGDYFKEILNIENLSQIFNAAQVYSMRDLIDYCLTFSDSNAKQLLETQIFTNFSADSFGQLISRNSFYAPEIDIFNAVRTWYEANSEEIASLKTLLDSVRLVLIPQTELLDHVRPSKLVDADTLLDAISMQMRDEPSKIVVHRGVKFPNINIATPSNGATVLSSDNEGGKKLLADDLPPDQRTAIGKKGSEGIVIDLGKPYIINHVAINLCKRTEMPLYSYAVEVSMDNSRSTSSWKCVSDYSAFMCRAKQKIYFEPMAVRYIRVRNTSVLQVALKVYRFSAMFSTENVAVDLQKGVNVPTRNVATIENNALVVEGVSRCRNALINGEISNYDWDSGYTCHQIGSGGIIVQLPQPYILSSIRILLWDCDDRYYSYYVAVSTDSSEWKTVVDRTNNKCRGWQSLIFDPTPVVFIKLVGTRNSSNEVFHVVHLEAPANPDAPSPGPTECLAIEEIGY